MSAHISYNLTIHLMNLSGDTSDTVRCSYEGNNSNGILSQKAIKAILASIRNGVELASSIEAAYRYCQKGPLNGVSVDWYNRTALEGITDLSSYSKICLIEDIEDIFVGSHISHKTLNLTSTDNPYLGECQMPNEYVQETIRIQTSFGSAYVKYDKKKYLKLNPEWIEQIRIFSAADEIIATPQQLNWILDMYGLDAGTIRSLCYRFIDKRLTIKTGSEISLFPYIRKHKKRLLHTFVGENNLEAVKYIFSLCKTVKSENLDELLALTPSEEIRAYISNYKTEHCSSVTQNTSDKDKGKRSLAEWRKILKFVYSDGGVIINDIKDLSAIQEIPDTISNKKVVGIDLHLADRLKDQMPAVSPKIFDRLRIDIQTELQCIKNAKLNDYVTWGVFPESGNIVMPIQWVVCDIHDDRILLGSKYWVDHKAFDQDGNTSLWQDCSLRTWLNTAFLNYAFSSEEKRYILDINCDSVTDKVFLLSVDEALNIQRNQCDIQDSFTFNSQKAENILKSESSGYCDNWSDSCSCYRYWLRSAGTRYEFDDPSCQRCTYVESSRIVDTGGERTDSILGVRPFIWISLK